MILLLLSAVLIGYVVLFYVRVAKYPKGPMPLPFFGNMLQIANPQRIQDDLHRWKASYGDIFTFWIFSEPVVVLNNYDLIKEALVTHGEKFTDRTNRFPETFFMHTTNGGVTFSSGESWKEQRRTALHILRDLGVGKNIMEQQVQEQLEQFVEHIRKEKDKDHVNFRWPIQVLVANIINQLLYRASYPFDNCSRLMNFVQTLTGIFVNLFENPLTTLVIVFSWIESVPFLGYAVVGKQKEQLQKCIAHVRQDVKTALEGYDKENEPECLVQAYYQKIGTNEHLRMDQLYNVCSDFFMAGSETTTTTLRWGLLRLAKHQDIQEKVRREVAEVVGFDRMVTMSDKSKMHYTTAFIAELQRVSNVFPVNLMRRNTEEVAISGHVIPIETMLLPHIFEAMQEDARFPEPEEFKPERFLNKDGSINAELVNQTLVFGMGKRQCAGEGLARVEIFLGISTVVQRFKLLPSPGQEIDLKDSDGAIRFPMDQTLRVEEVNRFLYR